MLLLERYLFDGYKMEGFCSFCETNVLFRFDPIQSWAVITESFGFPYTLTRSRQCNIAISLVLKFVVPKLKVESEAHLQIYPHAHTQV